MKKNLFLVLVSILVCFSSCQKEPVASFTASSTTALVGETISFSNTSVDGSSYEWDFGDGNTSSEKNPTHVYDSANTYSVSLIANSKNGKNSDEATATIVIMDLEPVAGFSFTGAGENAPCTVTFINSSTNATSYIWDFGDGNTSSDENPQHLYTIGGTYTVELTATGNGGTSSILKTVNIIDIPEPIADFTYSGGTDPAPSTVFFTNTSQNATSYNWDFGNGESSTSMNPVHTFNSGGVFTVNLTATGAGGTHSISKNINIANPIGPNADFSFTGAGAYAPCSVSFTNLSQNSHSYSWDFGDGGTSTSENPSHTYNTGGVFTVILTATGTGGTSSSFQNVGIEDAPTKLQINQLLLMDYPITDDYGDFWDVSDGPDIKWKILDENQVTTLFSGGIYWDIIYTDLPLTYTYGLPYTLTDINPTYTIIFFDIDSPDEIWMGGFYFEPSIYTDYPSTILMTTGGVGYFEFELSVTWLNSKNEVVNTKGGKSRIELVPIKSLKK